MDSAFPNTVSDLVDNETGVWSMERLAQFLWPCDINRVLEVPLGPPGAADCSYWFYSKNGRFTVRSCYHHIMAQAASADSSGSGHSTLIAPKEWKWLWGLQLPPKVRTFLWRAVNEIIPVRVALTRSHLRWDPFCPLCNMALDSTVHPFFECPRFVRIWEMEPFNINIPRLHTNFAEWFRFLRGQLNAGVFELACVVCWRIWWTRNRAVHEGVDGSGEDLIVGAEHYLDAYRASQFPPPPQGSNVAAVWHAPSPSVIKIYFDVGFIENDHFQVAVVVRSDEGKCVWWRVRRLTGQPSSAVGEARTH